MPVSVASGSHHWLLMPVSITPLILFATFNLPTEVKKQRDQCLLDSFTLFKHDNYIYLILNTYWLCHAVYLLLEEPLLEHLLIQSICEPPEEEMRYFSSFAPK
jgi:hypothetical protein